MSKRSAYLKRWRREHRIERAAQARAYRKKHPEEVNRKQREYYAANRDRIRARDNAYHALNRDKLNAALKLRRRSLYDLYRLTQEQYAELLAKQGNACAICLTVFSDDVKPYVDHSHSTHEVRGILCNSCNVALGKMNDSVVVLRRAITYLESPTTGIVVNIKRHATRQKWLQKRNEQAAVGAGK